MDHFINDPDQIVTEAIDSFLRLSDGRLARLDGYPSVKVVLRSDWDRSKVAVLSGGGSGHEPAHIGFVGRGMLTAAVCGDIFASPSVSAVLAAIVAVAGPSGCLLIVKNYLGDRLNFGLAAERARALGHRVEMVVVSDDIALTDAPQPRGLAGTLFVHKVAGHVAEAGGTLEQVAAAAQATATTVHSLGITLTTCSIPGRALERQIDEGQVELGLGIHGEPGAQRLAIAPIRELAASMAARIEPHLGRNQHALLLNNLGGVPPLEMSLVADAVLGTKLGEADIVFGPAPLMTAMDMRGFSISVLELDPLRVEALMSDVDCPAWPTGRSPGTTSVVPMPLSLKPAPAQASSDLRVRAMIAAVCDRLVDEERELNALDARAGDGDTGSTFATAARGIRASLDSLPLANPPALVQELSSRLAEVMGGSSGVLLSTFAAAAATALREGKAWPNALQAGLLRMQQYGGAQVGDRSMIDALEPAVRTLAAGGGLSEAAIQAEHGAGATAAMSRARAGRSSYLVGSDLRGVRDPGAAAVAVILLALADGRAYQPADEE